VLEILIFAVVICFISFLVVKIIESFQIRRSLVTGTVSQTWPFMFLVPVLLVVFGANFFLEQKPIQVAYKSKSLDASSDNPNVILITMDTVRADHLSLYGYERETTHELKKLSENATLYNYAIASGDMTLSTHASIFTGLYARSHGAHFTKNDPAGRALSEKFHTLAEGLLEKGYFTAGVVANSGYITHHFGMNQGFLYYNQAIALSFFGKNNATKPYLIRKSMRDFLAPLFPRAYNELINRTAEDINREVFTLLDNKAKQESPFFFFINYMDAHNPYIPPPPYDKLFPGKDETFTMAHYTTLSQEVMKLNRKVSTEESRHLLSQYDGGIAYIDFHIGKLIEKLKGLELYDNSIIIITSDHGEVFGERDLFNHAVSVYQDQIWIPLIIKYPNINEGRLVNEPASVVDLMPTILDVLKYEIPEGIQGKSLLEHDPGESREIIGESFPSGHLLTTHPRFNRIERAVFSWPYKYIESTAGKKELYDLSKDPKETRNIYNEKDIISRDLAERLNNWLKMTTPEIQSNNKEKLKDDALKRLKALGYIQ
ncbi:MAG: sulfatase family protein, partial [Planctomycetota bacterium]